MLFHEFLFYGIWMNKGKLFNWPSNIIFKMKIQDFISSGRDVRSFICKYNMKRVNLIK